MLGCLKIELTQEAETGESEFKDKTELDLLFGKQKSRAALFSRQIGI